MSDDEADTIVVNEPEVEKKKPVYIRSLRLSSEKLKKLGLRRGANEARFSITTKFQVGIFSYLWQVNSLILKDVKFVKFKQLVWFLDFILRCN